MCKFLHFPLLFATAIQSIAQNSVPFPLVVDFENRETGIYTKAMAQEDFPREREGSSFVSGYWYNGMDEGWAEIADENGNKALRAKYPAGCVGSNDCAVQIKWRIPKAETADTMWVSYKLKFEDGFEFVKGGKLPGLCGGQCYTGGNTPLQGDGWSARIMWRTGGSIVQYMYFADQAINYGDDMKWDFTGEQKVFEIDVWYSIATQVILNTVTDGTVGDKNGIVRSWLDGELSLEVDTLRLVDFADQKIDWFYISTFHGGSDISWAPSKDVYVRFDDFRIATTPPEYLSTTISTEKFSAKNMSVKFIHGALFFSHPLQEQMLFKLIDLKGRVVWESVIASGQSHIKPPVLSSGTYIWQLKGKIVSSKGITLLK